MAKTKPLADRKQDHDDYISSLVGEVASATAQFERSAQQFRTEHSLPQRAESATLLASMAALMGKGKRFRVLKAFSTPERDAIVTAASTLGGDASVLSEAEGAHGAHSNAPVQEELVGGGAGVNQHDAHKHR
jgi:hypothetical protein